MSDKRNIKFRGEELGGFSIDSLYRMATRSEIDHTAEFWSEQAHEWMPLAGIIYDLHPSSLNDLKSAGITRVEILGSGMDDCPACEAIQGKVYSIETVPTLPPVGCTCVPWCRCTEIAKD